MKVKNAIKIFKEYDNKNDEIFLMYWNKDVFIDSMEMTDKEWKEVVSKLDEYSFDGLSFDLVEAIQDELDEIKEKKMIEFTYTEAKELINAIGRFEITDNTYYGLTILEVGNKEYAIGTDDEADEAWEQALESYWDECVLPEVPDWLENYIDYEKWERDAIVDGRGHALSSYDGCETEIGNLIMFRIN